MTPTREALILHIINNPPSKVNQVNNFQARQTDRISDEKEITRAARKARRRHVELDRFEDALMIDEEDRMNDDVIRHLEKLSRNYR